MKIEEGKYYRTEDGRKVGPMVRWSEIDVGEPFEVVDHPDEEIRDCLWGVDGLEFTPDRGLDLVEEWTEEGEPKVVEAVSLYGSFPGWTAWIQSGNKNPGDTHKITFKTIDGEPDVTSIKMERISDLEEKL